MQAAVSITEATAPDAGVVAHPGELIALRHAARGLALAPPTRVASALAGPYGSPFRGRGLDFEEVRSYQAGDDVRNIDWRVTARTGRVHSKVFHEERERPVWLLYDGSASMRFGTRVAFKSVIAARAAALIAWSAQLAGDRVGALISSPVEFGAWPPGARENHLLRVLGAIAKATRPEAQFVAPGRKTGPETTMGASLERLREQVRTGSRVFVISDFYGFDERWQRSLADLSRRNQVDCLLVSDVLEIEAPRPGRYRVSDGTSVRSINTARSQRPFVRDFEDRREALSRFCRSRHIDLHELRTDEDFVARLATCLQSRGSHPRRRA
jgi:uncharacterized protein (DUF58 family)